MWRDKIAAPESLTITSLESIEQCIKNGLVFSVLAYITVKVRWNLNYDRT